MAWRGPLRTPAERRLGFRPPGGVEGPNVRTRQLWIAKSGNEIVLRDFYRVPVRDLAKLLVELGRRLGDMPLNARE